MRTISVVSMFAFALFAASACDSIQGMGGQQQPAVQPIPGVQPVQVPGQPVTVPGVQPTVPVIPTAVPGQVPAVTLTPVTVPIAPGVAPTVPGAVAAPTVPGQPAAAVAPTPAAPVAPAPTGDLLTDRLNEVKFQQAADRTATSALVKVALAAGKSQAYQVQLPGPPYCHTYVAVGDDKVKNVDVVVESPMAVAEAMDTTTDNRAYIANHCPTIAGAYKLRVKVADGEGEIAIQVFSK